MSAFFDILGALFLGFLPAILSWGVILLLFFFPRPKDTDSSCTKTPSNSNTPTTVSDPKKTPQESNSSPSPDVSDKKKAAYKGIYNSPTYRNYLHFHYGLSYEEIENEFIQKQISDMGSKLIVEKVEYQGLKIIITISGDISPDEIRSFSKQLPKRCVVKYIPPATSHSSSESDLSKRDIAIILAVFSIIIVFCIVVGISASL